MIILGIETSCDETATAVVKDGRKILSNVVASSEELHKKTRGIIPEVAAREQLKCMVPVVEEAVKSSKLKVKSLSALAVTVGPGLIGSLLVGVETAKTLSLVWKKPIIPVNHLQAHLYGNWVGSEDRRQKTEDGEPEFPAVGLVASGGHTDLVLMEDHGKIKWLGGTRDDAAGECFDKCARLMGLPYPGGPEIAAYAAKLKIKNSKLKIKFPRPMIKTKDFDFSFSGLKTAVLRQAQGKLSEKEKRNLAYEIQEAIIDCLVKKSVRAAEKYKIKSFLLAGGVAANKRLREKMKEVILNLKSKISFFVPPPELCTDNAACVASYAYFNYKPVAWKKIKANPSLGIEEIV
jgi:N6-L-threonylcarbamoyladenine synthase